MYDEALNLINQASNIVLIQAENPDGDSIGSSLALESLLAETGKTVSLHCPVEIPKYLRYLNGWDRISSDFDNKADLAIIVDTAAEVLLSKTLAMPGIEQWLNQQKVLVIDHHISQSDLRFSHQLLTDEAVSTGEIVYKLAKTAKWPINSETANNILASIMSDSLGLATQNVKAQTYFLAGELVELGASYYELENRRREFMKKPAEILSYKADLIKRIDYHLDGKLAIIHIPWEEIAKYSDRYNPSMLVLDEMRLVENVEVALAIKTYPDGKLTGKLRTNLPVATTIAGYFGGGGHEYAAGFRTYEELDKLMPEIIEATLKALKEEDQ